MVGILTLSLSGGGKCVFIGDVLIFCCRKNLVGKANSSLSMRLAFVRTVCLCVPFVLVFSLLFFSGISSAANYCATPGKDGSGTISGVVNTYYPGTASVSAGATSIPVGAPSGSATAIAAGDLLLIIQMQDADINPANTNNYGSGSGTGSGYTALNQTGYYEFAVAAGAVSGGSVSITSGLTNSYRSRAASATNGQSTYQVIRVPQYLSATVSATVSALNWNGSVGGIVAMDVFGTLTISGTITANGAGFRGGFGECLTGGAGANTDYRTSYTIADNASKGEGIAGSPYYMNRPATFDGAPVSVTGGSGYPDGTTTNASFARGAPGNAGGGGTDGDQAANDQNTGGGGGGNYAAGGLGGNSWSSNLAVGGVGGSAVAGIAYSRIVMGGGGGAGSTNNCTADSATYTNPAGISCSAGAGACSSGAPGGGIVILRANNITGAGTITANGGDGYNTLNDGAGGGGAGGSVVIYSKTVGSAIAYTNGGNGGNAWRGNNGGTANRHGPGGGGGGGFIAYYTGLGITTQVNGGLCGETTTLNQAYGATNGSNGSAVSYSSNPPGALPGAQCLPLLTVVKSASPSPSANPGGVVTYTIVVTNTGGSSTTSAIVTDFVPTYTTYVANSTRLNGITVAGDGATLPLIAGLLVDDNLSRGAGVAATGILPVGKTATVTFQVTVN
jgi:uncharacterized repeat protein (TIGR01451 family)